MLWESGKKKKGGGKSPYVADSLTTLHMCVNRRMCCVWDEWRSGPK